MINSKRIVPIQKCDFLSMVGTVMTIAGVTYSIAEANDVDGNYTIGDSGTKLADAPVKTIDFTGESTIVYFVPAYDFAGFKINGAAAEVDAEIKADGITLYMAELANGEITVDAISPLGNNG